MSNREHYTTLPTPSSTPQSPKKTLKRKDSFAEIYGDDSDRDEEGNWAVAAFKKLKERAETQAIESYLQKDRPSDVRARQNDSAILFHPDVVLPSYGAERARTRFLHSAELDGFYVPEQPVRSEQNMERLEKRLVWTEPDQGARWFDAFHRLNAAPIPLALEPRRPIRSDLTLLWHAVRTYPVPDDSHLTLTSDNLALTRIPIGAALPGGGGESRTLQLDVELGDLTLTEHTGISREARIVGQLSQRVETLRERRRTCVAAAAQERLDAARNLYAAEFGGDVYAASPVSAAGSEDRKAERLMEIKALRALRDAEFQTDRLLEFRILQDWDEISAARQASGSPSTGLTLLIETTRTSKSKAEKFMGSQIQNEIADLREEEALRSPGATPAASQEQMADGNRGRSTQRDQWDDKRVKIVSRNIRNRLEQCFRPPGLPEFSFRCRWDRLPPLLPEAASDRFQFSLTRAPPLLYLVFRYNKKIVTRTRPAQLDPRSCSARFRELDSGAGVFDLFRTGKNSPNGRCRFAVQVRDIPDDIQVEIYEKGALRDSLVATLPVPVPSSSDTTAAVDRALSPIAFSGTVAGSLACGVLNLACTWGADSSGRVLAPPPPPDRSEDPIGIATLMTPHNAIDFWKLMSWAREAGADPNDPRSQNLARLGQLCGAAAPTRGNHFRLDVPKWMRMAISEIGVGVDAGSARLSLLSKRNNARIRSASCPQAVTGIPLQDYEIEGSLIAFFNTDTPARVPAYVPSHAPLLSPPPLLRGGSSLLSIRSASLLPSLSATFPRGGPTSTPSEIPLLQRIRTHDLLRHAYRPRALRHDDLVREEKLPTRRQRGLYIPDWLRARRPLRPSRDTRADRKAVEGACEQVTMLVHVLRGAGVPARAGEARAGTRWVDTPRPVRPFVQATLRSSTARTATAEGPAPLWNDTLALEVDLANGGAASLTADFLRIDLFDEVIVDLAADQEDRDRIVHRRSDRAWLGCVEVPVCVVQNEIRLAGEFLVQQPHALVGYEQPADERTTLHLFITLEPVIAVPSADEFEFHPLDPPVIHKLAARFTSSLPSLTNTRVTAVLVETLSGQTALLTRFVRPQSPPRSLPPTPSALLRYVSSIPTFPSRALYGRSALWTTTDQMLTLGAGGPGEHAVLLANLLAATTAGYWAVCLGRDAAGQPVAWVFGRQDAECTLWDPVTGTCWSVKDEKCPLTEIGQIFDATNIWANIQTQAHPARVNFAFNDSRQWRALFRSPNAGGETQTIQSEKPIYRAVDPAVVLERQARIERTLVSAIESWRGIRLTRWNRLASRTFQSILPLLESSLLKDPPAIQAGQQQQILATHAELAKLRAVYRLRGSPQWMPYTDVASIAAAVRATEVYECDDEGCEFACAVLVAGYEGDVSVVWVWIAALIRKV
ncbi:Coiled-coil and C2 domain-containing protein 2A [Geranomyces variabilis]|nr:Coiled-coil and C2 domain-containing protein 2A [Geranomyces variabilis]